MTKAFSLSKIGAAFIAVAAAFTALTAGAAQAQTYGGYPQPQGYGYGNAYGGGRAYTVQQAPQQHYGPQQGGQEMSVERYFAGTWRFETSMGVMVTQFSPTGQYVSQFYSRNGQPMGQGGGAWRAVNMSPQGVITLEIFNQQARRPGKLKENYQPLDQNTMRYGDGMGYRIG